MQAWQTSFIAKKQETGLSDLHENLMFTRDAHGCFGRVKLEGRNAGAALIARRGNSPLSEDCCSINIYVSNNVQGVNNSVLVDSEVKLGDPGVCLSLKGLKLDRGFQKTSKKKSELAGMFWMFLFALIAVIFLFTFI